MRSSTTGSAGTPRGWWAGGCADARGSDTPHGTADRQDREQAAVEEETSIQGFLAPGGHLYLREGHPALWALDLERDDQLLVTRYPYFERRCPLRWLTPTTYTDGPPLEHPVTFEWSHGLGETVTALIDAGLRVEFLHEHRFCDWRALPWMTEGPDGLYRLPGGEDRLPLMYSLRARKDA